MMQEQDNDQVKQYAHIRKILEQSMVLGQSKQAKYKQGYVTIQTKSGNWRERFIVLASKYITGHRLKDKVCIIMVIATSLFIVETVSRHFLVGYYHWNTSLDYHKKEICSL